MSDSSPSVPPQAPNDSDGSPVAAATAEDRAAAASQQGAHESATAAQQDPAPALSLDWTQLPSSAPPVRYPMDVADIDVDETELLIVGTAGQKITHMGQDLYKYLSSNLTSLVLRSHMIKQMEGLEGLAHLDVLELYDNQVQALECLGDGPDGAPGRNLRVLYISYNAIRDLQPVELCPNLQELCELKASETGVTWGSS